MQAAMEEMRRKVAEAERRESLKREGMEETERAKLIRIATKFGRTLQHLRRRISLQECCALTRQEERSVPRKIGSGRCRRRNCRVR